MASAFALPTPDAKALDLLANTGTPTTAAKLKGMGPAKARAAAQDFEAVFLNSMFQNMFTGISGDGPFGGSGAVGVWRSMLTDEYSKSFAKAGGIGIADQVYRTLITQQEARS
jgi:peptidoglycan hydrolase FlgJ